MKIFEVLFDNGWSYEDHNVENSYYETFAEAQNAFNNILENMRADDNNYDWYQSAFVVLNELELGTQIRTCKAKEYLYMQCLPNSHPFDKKKADAELEELRKRLSGLKL